MRASAKGRSADERSTATAVDGPKFEPPDGDPPADGVIVCVSFETNTPPLLELRS